ncbi:MAG: glycoside hydrolase family 78 protein, partial [Lentimicrobiaceae bacterium]|nr:glycoside hydrolase family 78 protein [Lentimicrobiaceae bacterium]
SARLYITSLGLYQVFLNGKKVGSDLFTPGWTSYNKRLQYQTYDVIRMLKPENAIGAVVGDGWYRGNIVLTKAGNYYGDKLSLFALLEIKYTDGTVNQITTDGSWQTGNGPIIESDIYNGEIYDARLDIPGWDQPGFVSQTFSQAKIFDHPRNILVASRSYPIRAITEIKTKKIIKTPKGEIVYDLGQNMVGWVRLKVKGEKGDWVVMKFAEVLDKEENFYTDNLRAAKATDKYILNGVGEEIFESHFTYHGFRYVKLEHFTGIPDLNTITGIVIHSDMPLTGSFVCSDSLINQLQHNIQWTQRGNFFAVPTDCPQRNERLGWIGDAQFFSSTAAFNFSVAPFYTNWMFDLSADQFKNGGVPGTIPDALSGRGISAGWGDAAVVIPWRVYQAYGDIRILQNQYLSMKAWVEFMHQKSGQDNLWTGDYGFGDWLAFASDEQDNPAAITDKDLITNAYYASSTELLAQIATILGKTDDARKYEELARSIKKAFLNEYVTSSGRLVSNTQTAYALALSFGLIPDTLVLKAASYLAEDVRKMKHLTTGIVGTQLLCKVLSDHGYADLAFMLLMRKEYPSWLYQVTQGATTIWERWDGQKSNGSFQTATMNSFNHYALGAIGEWLYSYVAGIIIDSQMPGYKHFILQPHQGGGLKSTSAELNTFYGTIKSAWKLEDDKMIYTCSVPPNSSATVCFENGEEKSILLNNLPLPNDGLYKVSTENGKVKIEIGSGNYMFSLQHSILKQQ